MNFKKFISSVSALAIAGSAFAGMAVTANAAGTQNGTYSFAVQNRITNNNDGTFTTSGNAGNQYALALADFSGMADLNIATSVTVEFDSIVPSGSRWYIGVGNKNTRGTNANGSSKATYNKDGLLISFGTSDGTYYRVNGGTNNSDAFGTPVHASITLDRANSTYSYTLSSGDKTLFSESNVKTTVTDISVVEAYSWLSNATITLSDVTVTAEIPEVVMYNATIETVPYAAIKAGDDTVAHSDYLGKAVVSGVEGTTADYTVTKGGYTDKTVSITFDAAKTVPVALTAAEENVLFFEDYATTDGKGGLYNTQTETGNKNPWSRISDGAAQFIGGGSGNRTVTPVFTYTPSNKDVYTLTFDVALYDSSSDVARYSQAVIKDVNGKALATIRYENSGKTNIDKITVNDTVAETSSVGSVTVVVDAVSGDVTTTTSGVTSTINVEGAAAPASIAIDLGRNHRFSLDNVKITGETGEAPPAADLSAIVGNAILGEGTTTVEAEKRATGFIATITNKGNANGSVKSIKWTVTDSATPTHTVDYTPEMTTITLEPNGSATIGLIVKGLYDAAATATAVLN